MSSATAHMGLKCQPISNHNKCQVDQVLAKLLTCPLNFLDSCDLRESSFMAILVYSLFGCAFDF